MNLLDSDGDTPLYVVENVETARYLVEHGAAVDHRNHEGLTVCNYDPLCCAVLTDAASSPRNLCWTTFQTSPHI